MFTNLEKLIYGRNAIEEYKKINQIKGCKSITDRLILEDAMYTIEMTIDEFFAFSFQQNFMEVDRCYRFRRIDDENAIALCDNCIGRSVTPCFITDCVGEYLDPFAKIVPDSNILKEKEEEANRLGVPVPHIPSVASVFLTKGTGGTYAPYCIGKAVKIIEPNFDIFWKMEEVINFGKFRYNEMLKANGAVQ